MIKKLIQKIVKQAQALKDKHTTEKQAPVNYACIFAQSEDEYKGLFIAAKLVGKVIKETPTGPLFQMEPIETEAGKLQLVKVRKPDPTRPERGDADFTVADYTEFKKTHLDKPGFKLIERPDMEMIELIDPQFEVKAYFSNPPLDKQLGIIN